MLDSIRSSASLFAAGLRLAAIASLLLLSGCGSGSDSKPADEVVDQCPMDDDKLEEGLCGCGIPDTDNDDDGTPNCQDPCPDDPGTMVDEFGFCGNTGASETATPGEALVLAANGAVLSIPADVLEPGTIATLTVVDPDTLDSQPNGADEIRITPVYSLTFSQAQLTAEDLIFALDIPASISTRWDAHIKVEGGLATEGLSDRDWSIVFGDYDPQQSLLMIRLGATADRFLIAGVSGDAVVSGVTTDPLIETAKSPESMAARLATAELFVPDEVLPEWNAFGWVIFCEPRAFSKVNNTKCNPSLPAFIGMTTDLGEKLYASDQKLTALGHPVGDVYAISEIGIAATKAEHLIYDPDNRSATTSSIGGNPLRYFVAFVDPNVADTTAGYYEPSNKQLWLDINEPDITAIHELMHAVQYHQVSKEAWKKDWIIEGLASAVEAFAPSSSMTSGEDFRYEGDWRDWKLELRNDDQLNAYQAAEYWLSWDSTLGSLAALYATGLEMPGRNQYTVIHEKQLEVGTPSLRESYLNLIQSRNDDLDYPFCAEKAFSCSGSSCSEAILGFNDMTAQCMDFSVDFEDSCESVPTEVSVTLELATPNPDVKLMVDGMIHEADTAVPFSDAGRIWAISTDYTAFAGIAANLVFRNETSCNIKLVRQQILTAASAVASQSFMNLLGPGGLSESTTYNSFEDLSVNSNIATFVTGSPLQKVIVEPLNLGAWEAEHDVRASHQYPEGADISLAGASSFVSTDTDIVGNSVITAGVQTVTASISGMPMFATATSSSEYTYAFESAPVELTLDWGCSMSNVRVKLINPDTGVPETLLSINNNLDLTVNNWECETRTWTIPPDYLLNIRIISRFDEWLDDSTEVSKDSGGGFEIKLQTMPLE